LHRVASLENDQNAELADVEEVNQTLELILGELGTQYETLQGKAIQEQLNAVSLHDVVCVNHGLSFQNA